MKTTDYSMIANHRRCDELFNEMEQAVLQHRWPEAIRLCEQFTASIECMFRIEEELLFPMLVKSGAEAEETVQLRKLQHVHIKHLMSLLVSSLDTVSKDNSVESAEKLLARMQRGSLKKELIRE